MTLDLTSQIDSNPEEERESRKMAGSLEERLRSHAQAFDGLLSLIPAKIYYGQDNSDQYQRKKQTKEQAKAAKRAKLDPDNAKTARDVMEENARKRKRDEDADGVDNNSDAAQEDLEPVDGVVLEKVKEGLRERKSKKVKKDKGSGNNALADGETGGDNTDPSKQASASASAKAEKRREKREQKRAKEQSKAGKIKEKNERKEREKALVNDENPDVAMDTESNDHVMGGEDIDSIDLTGMVEPEERNISRELQSALTASPSPKPLSPTFDNSTLQSGASSISSVAPPATENPASNSKTGKHFAYIAANPEALRARLQQKIEALRAARKADNPDSTPVRNRQDLMESRRRKEEQRRAHKKELRQQAREEEKRQRDEALARGSPLLSPQFMSPATGSNAISSPLNETANNFSFGRIAFENGQSMTPNLGAVLDPHKDKGPQDPKTALQAAKHRMDRIASLDPAKRTDIEEKDIWLNARKRAHGERVRDDSSLLKKTLKRKEKQKRKSEKEWNERIEGVQKGKAMKQKKREGNLAKRRDEKGSGGGKKKAKVAKTKKVRARPGFEGSFRAKVGGRNNK